jgi:hypothetical protein
MRNADGALHEARYTTGPLKVILADGTPDRTEVDVTFTMLAEGSDAHNINL